MSVFAKSGSFVCKTSRSQEGWVYDVKVYTADNKLLAVVGFCEQQSQGAVFWQNEVDFETRLKYDSSHVQEVARKFTGWY